MSDTVTGTLTDFLLARIAEDEQCARYRIGIRDEHGLAQCSPDRVLAECEAKRRIVEEYVRCLGVYKRTGARGEWASAYLVVLQLLALPYADHPDYRDEWRP